MSLFSGINSNTSNNMGKSSKFKLFYHCCGHDEFWNCFGNGVWNSSQQQDGGEQDEYYDDIHEGKIGGTTTTTTTKTQRGQKHKLVQQDESTVDFTIDTIDTIEEDSDSEDYMKGQATEEKGDFLDSMFGWTLTPNRKKKEKNGTSQNTATTTTQKTQTPNDTNALTSSSTSVPPPLQEENDDEAGGETNKARDESRSNEVAFTYWTKLDQKVEKEKQILATKHEEETNLLIAQKRQQDELRIQRLQQLGGRGGSGGGMMNLATCTSVDNSDIEFQKHILEESHKVEVERKQAELEMLQTAIHKRLTTAGSPITRKKNHAAVEDKELLQLVEELEATSNDNVPEQARQQQQQQQQQEKVKPFFKNLRPSSSTTTTTIQPPPQNEQKQKPHGRYQLRKTGFWDEPKNQQQGRQKKMTMEVKWNHPARSGTATSTTTTTGTRTTRTTTRSSTTTRPSKTSSFTTPSSSSSFKTTTAATKIGPNNIFVRQSQFRDHQPTKEESISKRQAMEQKWMRKSQQQQDHHHHHHQQQQQQQDDNDDVVSESQQTDIINNHHRNHRQQDDNNDVVSESQQTDIINNHHHQQRQQDDDNDVVVPESQQTDIINNHHQQQQDDNGVVVSESQQTDIINNNNHHFKSSSPTRRSNTKEDDKKVMLVLLSSTIIGQNRNQRVYQDRVMTWLSQRRRHQLRGQEKIPLETVDASAQPLRRNQLLAASGKGLIYPQLFLQQGENLAFVGDYDSLHRLNETGRLTDEYFMSLLPVQNKSKNTKKILTYKTRTNTSWIKPDEKSHGSQPPATASTGTTNQPRRVTNYWQQQQSQEESKQKRKSLAAKWESRHKQQQHVVVEPPTVPRVSTSSSWGPKRSNYEQEEKKETEVLDTMRSSPKIPESENLSKADKPRRVTGYWEQRRSSKGGEEENNTSDKNLIESEEEPKQDDQPTTLEIKRRRLQEKRQEYQQLKLDASRRLEQEIGLMIGMEKKEAAKEKTKQLVGMYQDLEKSHAESRARETTTIALKSFRKKKNEPPRSQMAAWKEKELNRRNAEYQKQKHQSRIPRYHNRHHQEESSSTAWPDCPSDARFSDLLSPSQQYNDDDDRASNDSVPDKEISKGHKAWHKRASKVIENLEGIKEESNNRALQHNWIG